MNPSVKPAGVLVSVPVEGSKSDVALNFPTATNSPNDVNNISEISASIVPFDVTTPDVETSTSSPVDNCARTTPDDANAVVLGSLLIAPTERGTAY